MLTTRCLSAALLLCCVCGLMPAEERTQTFDADPGWESHNNRIGEPGRKIKQDFGYSPTAHAGGKLGEAGGFIQPAGEPAYYAKRIPERTFADPLHASGTLAMSGRQSHVLVCFFNANTLNEWRTPNTIALRLAARDEVFDAWVEYCTARWRAGGDSPKSFPTVKDPQTGRERLKGFPAKGAVHRWSLTYDPKANNGGGAVTATIGDVTAVCHLDAGHKADGAVFNRFGLMTVMKSADTGGEVWLDDLTVNGEKEDFSKDPGWEARNNRREYVTTLVRPRFDFGYSPSQFAGGKGKGELGGLIYRGDCRYPERMASYADRLDELMLDKPLKASGKVSLRRGVTDSGVLIGFFHSKDSMAVNPSQDTGLPRSFLGISTDAPSREGFYLTPCYRVNGDGRGHAVVRQPLYIYPDGKPHAWTLDYSPTAAEGRGRITVTLDGGKIELDLQPGHRAAGTRFDRFGIITTWVDGNSQTIYFDDLTFTCRQE